MKIKNYISVFLSILATVTFLFSSTETLAQKKERTRVRAYYEKLANGNLQIRAILTSGSGRNMQNIPSADIEIISKVNEEENPLAVIQTNEAGEAVLQIEGGFPLDRNDEGFAILNANFAGNDSLRSSNRDIEFKDLNLEVKFEEEDSIRMLKVFAYEDSAGIKIPVEEIDIDIQVQRLLSKLTLESLETNKAGKVAYEFPDDIPGDNIGKLTVIVSVIEDRDYGTVTKINEVNWGTIVDYTISSNGRTLFGDEAPLWMIIGVIIVLGGAWYHFIWAILKVWSIRKSDNLSDR